MNLKAKAFLKQYGTDDTSRALIVYWFKKRHIFSALSILSGAATGAAAIALGSSANSNSLGGFAETLGLTLTVATGTLATILFLIPFLTHSRKKLLRLLTNYRNNESLPKKYRKKLVIQMIIRL
jgi:hypothetical protein